MMLVGWQWQLEEFFLFFDILYLSFVVTIIIIVFIDVFVVVIVIDVNNLARYVVISVTVSLKIQPNKKFNSSYSRFSKYIFQDSKWLSFTHNCFLLLRFYFTLLYFTLVFSVHFSIKNKIDYYSLHLSKL